MVYKYLFAFMANILCIPTYGHIKQYQACFETASRERADIALTRSRELLIYASRQDSTEQQRLDLIQRLQRLAAALRQVRQRVFAGQLSRDLTIEIRRLEVRASQLRTPSSPFEL